MTRATPSRRRHRQRDVLTHIAPTPNVTNSFPWNPGELVVGQPRRKSITDTNMTELEKARACAREIPNAVHIGPVNVDARGGDSAEIASNLHAALQRSTAAMFAQSGQV